MELETTKRKFKALSEAAWPGPALRVRKMGCSRWRKLVLTIKTLGLVAPGYG
jgi:hypothetical protein